MIMAGEKHTRKTCPTTLSTTNPHTDWRKLAPGSPSSEAADQPPEPWHGHRKNQSRRYTGVPMRNTGLSVCPAANAVLLLQCRAHFWRKGRSVHHGSQSLSTVHTSLQNVYVQSLDNCSLRYTIQTRIPSAHTLCCCLCRSCLASNYDVALPLLRPCAWTPSCLFPLHYLRQAIFSCGGGYSH
jgi:hypothetical protein